MLQAFIPQGDTALITGSTTATAATQVSTGGAYGMLVTNITSQLCYVAFGGSTITAAIPSSGTFANGIPFPGGAIQVLNPGPNRYVSIISTAGAPVVTFTPGEGI